MPNGLQRSGEGTEQGVLSRKVSILITWHNSTWSTVAFKVWKN